MDYKKTIKERVGLLPEGLKFFVLNESWRTAAKKIAEQLGMNEDKYVLFENEIFLVLVCFEPKKDFSVNIAKELGIDDELAHTIGEEVDKNIFSNVSSDLEAIEEQINDNNKITDQLKPNSVGTDFEQVILNQARAMRPAVASASTEQPVARIKEEGKEGGQKLVHDYAAGQDPYREPLG
jgi:hypothetical protein